MNRQYCKLVILFILSVLLIGMIPTSVSRYESEVDSNVQNEVALYILDTNYIVKDINLGRLSPSPTPYVYRFSISNNDGNKRNEVDLEYSVSIKTTTNILLEYSLYLNENYQTGTNIITSDELIKDDYDMYFKQMSTNTRQFSYLEDEVDHYTLLIYFPMTYNKHEYQDLIESIELIISSKQILDETE